LGTFGEKFRTERERRGFTLDDVSNVTKINSRMLKAIEDEHFDVLPGGVFNKGFVRAYAKHLGLNDEEAIGEYLLCLRQAQVDAQSASWEQADPSRVPRQLPGRELPAPGLPSPGLPGRVPQPSPSQVANEIRNNAPQKTAPTERLELKSLEPKVERIPPTDRKETGKGTDSKEREPVAGHSTVPLDSSRQPQRPLFGDHSAPTGGGIPWRTPAILLGIVVLAALLWNRHSRNASAQGTSPTPAAPPQATAAATPAVENSSPNGVMTSGAVTGSANAPASAPTAKSEASPADSPSSTVAKQSATAMKDEDESDVATRPIPPRSNPPRTPLPKRDPGVKPAPTFTLVIRATETSWISVTADGQTVNQETLIAPAHTSIRASRQIVVRAGNAAGVSFSLNGKEIPANGAEGEVKTYVFDSTGLAPAPPRQHALTPTINPATLLGSRYFQPPSVFS
jgi:cytoskeletal protein RodZ